MITQHNEQTASAEGSGSKPQQPLPSKADYTRLGKQLIAIVAVQILSLVGFGASKAYILSTGQVVTLQAMTVDPSDPMRGEYANLSYKDVSTIASQAEFVNGETVYVLLSRGRDYWRACSITKTYPRKESNQIVIKGRVNSEIWAGAGLVNIEYGIGRLYMPEGASMALQNRVDKIKVEVAVDQSGQCCIKKAMLDGHVFYDGTSMLNPFI